MMHIHLDAVGGVAGDMFVAAMLDAFPALIERAMADAGAVIPPGAGVPALTAGSSAAIACRRFGLAAGRSALLGAMPRRRKLERFADLRAEIGQAELSEGTAASAIAMLTLLAEAESAIHGVALDDVHFHELADWDSVLDVVAAGSIVAALGEVDWSVSALPRGGGLVQTQHGLLPVPAPAAAALLEGFSFRDDGVGGERVTPTGAAILRYLAPTRANLGEGRLLASGTGAGTRDLPGMPNILRVLAFDDFRPDDDRVAAIAFEIDDMTGEEIGVASEALRAVPGVLDVSLVPMLGKKQRPVTGFRILARLAAVEAVSDACFTHTATIGLRWSEQRRRVLRRVETQVAGIRTKSVERPNRERTAKAESDDLEGTLATRRRKRRRAEEAGT